MALHMKGYAKGMSKIIQLRKVPDALRRRLKARATTEGLSLSDFLIREARKIVERPTDRQLRKRLAALGGREPGSQSRS